MKGTVPRRRSMIKSIRCSLGYALFPKESIRVSLQMVLEQLVWPGSVSRGREHGGEADDRLPCSTKNSFFIEGCMQHRGFKSVGSHDAAPRAGLVGKSGALGFISPRFSADVAEN